MSLDTSISRQTESLILEQRKSEYRSCIGVSEYRSSIIRGHGKFEVSVLRSSYIHINLSIEHVAVTPITKCIAATHTCELARKERHTSDASGTPVLPVSGLLVSSAGATTSGSRNAPPAGDSKARSGNFTAASSGMMTLSATAIYTNSITFLRENPVSPAIKPHQQLIVK
jgi:hypothetical protein